MNRRSFIGSLFAGIVALALPFKANSEAVKLQNWKCHKCKSITKEDIRGKAIAYVQSMFCNKCRKYTNHLGE